MRKSDYYAELHGINVHEEIIERWPGRFKKYKIYDVPCKTCGEIIEMKRYVPCDTHLCPRCKNTWKKVEKRRRLIPDEEFNFYREKEQMRFYEAVDMMKNQIKNFKPYEEAVELVKRRYYIYDSKPEVMAAIELVKKGYKVIPQQKVKSYRVDFALPDQKLIVEIDGSLYHEKSYYPSNRDAEIILALGIDWEVLHVNAGKISKNIRCLVPEIRKLATPGKI